MTPDANALCVFAVKRGNIENKEIYCNVLYPFYLSLTEKCKKSPYCCGRLASYIDVNPKTDCSELADQDLVSFVPMQNVQEKNNVVSYDLMPYYTVKKGFTTFKKGDLIWAKITPCMQNGKSCIVDKMPTEIGFGSTEFHVIRKRSDKIYMPFLWAILSSDSVLRAAQATFSGSAGQQRVSASFIEKFPAVLPEYDLQVELVTNLESKLVAMKQKLHQAEELLKSAKENVFSEAGIEFSEYTPSLFNFSRLKDIREMGINCNAHSAYLRDIFASLRRSKYYAGNLEDFVEVNPSINRKGLNSKSIVSFVPMPAVKEKINSATYQSKEFEDVKTGFTAFQKNDLLWAKITPCMQNGKSFLATDMPTEYGFGSTEFHVLRQKSSSIYMPYLWVLLSEEHILEAAQGMFCGSAGQQRVPDTFLKKFPTVLPPFEMQRQLADEVFKALVLSKRIREDAELDWQAARTEFEKALLED